MLPLPKKSIKEYLSSMSMGFVNIDHIKTIRDFNDLIKDIDPSKVSIWCGHVIVQLPVGTYVLFSDLQSRFEQVRDVSSPLRYRDSRQSAENKMRSFEEQFQNPEEKKNLKKYDSVEWKEDEETFVMVRNPLLLVEKLEEAKRSIAYFKNHSINDVLFDKEAGALLRRLVSMHPDERQSFIDELKEKQDSEFQTNLQALFDAFVMLSKGLI